MSSRRSSVVDVSREGVLHLNVALRDQITDQDTGHTERQ